MDGHKSTNDNQPKDGTNQPRDRHPVGTPKSLELETTRPAHLVSDRGLRSAGTPSVPGGSGGTEGSQGTLSDSGSQTPLAQMHRLIERAGEEPFPDDIIRCLSERIDDRIVDIRPDGLIFVSHPHYRDRLDAAFGVGGWALVPLAAPRVQDNRVLYYGFLKARGQYIGDAVGGSQYYPNNPQGNYDNSVEAAKSDCLVRACKALPMFRECWDKEYADYWKATYAEEGVTRQSQGKKVWKKKGFAMRDFTTRPDRQGQDEYRKIAKVEDENHAHIAAISGKGQLRLEANDAWDETESDYYDREAARAQIEEHD